VNLRKAKALCAGCEVRLECLKAGMDEDYGLWGGVSPKARRRMRKAAS
jgi:WhiB family redox-sensing transcriptional regulator